MSRIGENNKDYYKLDKSRQIPVRWTAPEIFTRGKFYPFSDIWSFGVVVYEIFSNGYRPYVKIEDNEKSN